MSVSLALTLPSLDVASPLGSWRSLSHIDLDHVPLQRSNHALCWAIFTACVRWAISAGLAIFSVSQAEEVYLLEVDSLSVRGTITLMQCIRFFCYLFMRSVLHFA